MALKDIVTVEIKIESPSDAKIQIPIPASQCVAVHEEEQWKFFGDGDRHTVTITRRFGQELILSVPVRVVHGIPVEQLRIVLRWKQGWTTELWRHVDFGEFSYSDEKLWEARHSDGETVGWKMAGPAGAL